MPHLETTIGGIEYFMPLIPASGDVLFHYQINTTTAFTGIYTNQEINVSSNTAVKCLVTFSAKIDSTTSVNLVSVRNSSASHYITVFWNGSVWRRGLVNSEKTTIKNSCMASFTMGSGSDIVIGHPGSTAKTNVHYLDVWIWT